MPGGAPHLVHPRNTLPRTVEVAGEPSSHSWLLAEVVGPEFLPHRLAQLRREHVGVEVGRIIERHRPEQVAGGGVVARWEVYADEAAVAVGINRIEVRRQ